MRCTAALVFVLFVAGCGGSSTSEPATSAEGGSSQAASGRPITVTETEFSIAPATINVPSPGMYVIKVVNKGSVTHALEVERNGASVETDDIAPGGSATVRVNLTKAGSYEVDCPVDGHRDKGMTAYLVVGNVTGAPTIQETTTEGESGTTTRSGY